MKKLLFIRHAKSDWSNSLEIQDIDRPLNNKGIRNAYDIGQRLKNKDIIPDLILSSPACRALYTASIFAGELGNIHPRISISKNLYHPSPNDFFDEINLVDKKINTLFIFTHNPALNQIGEEYIDDFSENIPTCGILAFKLDINNWTDISKENMGFWFFDYPKNKSLIK